MCRENLIDFEKYKLFEDGRIWSKFYEKYLNGNIGTKGYLQLWLTCKDGKKRYFMKHRVLAHYFIPNPENKPCIDHINSVRTDNRIENLRWCTYTENNNNPITKKRMSIGSTGKKASEETKKKMSVSHTGKKRKKIDKPQ